MSSSRLKDGALHLSILLGHTPEFSSASDHSFPGAVDQNSTGTGDSRYGSGGKQYR
jgi:hypothetical protein